jgi:DNA repair protein RadD
VLDELMARPVAGGLTVGDLIDREQLREKLRERHDDMRDEHPQSIPVPPQRRRRAARGRLAERTNSVVARIINDLQLSRQGREVARSGLGRGGAANVQLVTQLLNGAINESLGIRSGARGTLTADQTAAALGALDDLGDQVRDRIKEAIRRSN